MTSCCCHQKLNMLLVCSMKVSPSGRVRHKGPPSGDGVQDPHLVMASKGPPTGCWRPGKGTAAGWWRLPSVTLWFEGAKMTSGCCHRK